MPRIKLGNRMSTLVDWADFETLSRHAWKVQRVRTKAYACRWEADRLIYMHAELMQPEPGFQVDHVNGDGLDNRRSNLRVCTPWQNSVNRTARASNTGFLGAHHVYRFGKTKNFVAHIRADGKRYHLGYFATAEEAALAHDLAAVHLHGEFASLNFPDRRDELAATPWLRPVSRPRKKASNDAIAPSPG